MNKAISLGILLSTFFCFSQENEKVNLFFDENNRQVDIVSYLKKCSSFLYNCNKKEQNDTIINTTYELYKFGKLTKIETLQIQKLLIKSTDTKDFKNKTIIISFINSLYSQEEHNTLIDSNSIKSRHIQIQSELKYTSRRGIFDQNQKKCFKRFKKQNINPIYLYKKNKGYNYVSENIKWHKAHPVISKYFFNNKYSMMLILKPDGNYFRYLNISEEGVKELLKKEWTPFIKDYQIAKTNLLKNKNGFFNKNWMSGKKRMFYIDKGSMWNKRPRNLPNNTIVVSSRSEISNYLSKLPRCYSHVSF